MANKASSQRSPTISSVLYRNLPSFSTGSHSFFSQFVMIGVTFVLFVAFLPYVSCSPTPASVPLEAIHNMNKNSQPYVSGPNADPANSREDSPASAFSVHDEQMSAPSSSVWFGQPRTHANQFLMSHVNENEVIVPKWFTRLNQNAADDDELDGDSPSGDSIHKRSSFYPAGTYQTVKKRKQISKPPMEVMNEIVNSIYLKR